ncbi:MAG: protein phosphatase 2C domain-containing protein [Actinomycetota bacterium]|nr:protein phosphatase 2C domain-containing protein [Actinomycetota bacterium]
MSTHSPSAAGATHVGHVRDNNEDAYVITDRVWAVADGLGGHAGGEDASAAAVDAAQERLEVHAGSDPEQAVRAAFRAAHDTILMLAEAEPSLADMGTTMVLAWRDDDGMVRIGNVGDSRAYLLADGELRPLTTDDNEAQALLDRGELTAEQARVHPGQFRLTKVLGTGSPEVPQPREHLLPGTAGRLLLCSDGLNSELSDDEIAALLADGTPQQAADRLVRAALDAGGHDNVTVVVVDLGSGA